MQAREKQAARAKRGKAHKLTSSGFVPGLLKNSLVCFLFVCLFFFCLFVRVRLFLCFD